MGKRNYLDVRSHGFGRGRWADEQRFRYDKSKWQYQQSVAATLKQESYSSVASNYFPVQYTAPNGRNYKALNMRYQSDSIATLIKCPVCGKGTLRPYVGLSPARSNSLPVNTNKDGNPFSFRVPEYRMSGIEYYCNVCGDAPIKYEMDAQTADAYRIGERDELRFFDVMVV